MKKPFLVHKEELFTNSNKNNKLLNSPNFLFLDYILSIPIFNIHK